MKERSSSYSVFLFLFSHSPLYGALNSCLVRFAATRRRIERERGIRAQQHTSLRSLRWSKYDGVVADVTISSTRNQFALSDRTRVFRRERLVVVAIERGKEDLYFNKSQQTAILKRRRRRRTLSRAFTTHTPFESANRIVSDRC